MLTTIIKRIGILALLLGIQVSGLFAQARLDAYIREGIGSNLILQERKLGLQRGMLGLQQAKRLFLPAVNFGGSYTLAAGGRSIDFPVGDLMNPVYSTLNALTQSNAFPQIENEKIQFLPNNFYDLRLRTSMPLINSDLIHNQRIQSQAMEMKGVEVESYKLELVRDIRNAYYQAMMANEALGIYQSALGLVEQNLKTQQSLLANGKGLPAMVLRAESEVEKVKAEIAQAQSQRDNAQAYFNFLLNRDAAAAVEFESVEIPANLPSELEQVANTSARPELQQLQIALNINEEATLMDKQYWLPRLSTFLDLGSQGFDFKLNDQTLYVMWGLQLDIPIWNGGRDQTAIALREQSRKEFENKLAQAEQGFALAAFAKRNSTLAALESWQRSQAQVDAAAAYQRLVEKGAAQGTFSLIEQVDARNNLTQAQLLQNIRKYETLMAWAAYLREIAQPFE